MDSLIFYYNQLGNSMNRIKIINLLKSGTPRDNIIAKGWVRTRRDSSNFLSLLQKQRQSTEQHCIMCHNP